MLVAESQAVDGSWATTFGAHTGIGTLPIAFFGTPAQKARYLPDLAAGRKVAAYALSEAGSGSDALGAKTVARLSEDGTHYLVNGGEEGGAHRGLRPGLLGVLHGGRGEINPVH